MASCSTTRWVSSAPYVTLTVTESSNTATTSTLSWTLQYISTSPANSNGARAYTVKIGGETVKTGSYDIDGVTGTKTLASGTKTINKTTSAQSVAFSVSFTFNLTWSGVYGGTKSASGSISIPAKTSYTVKYNANGGSGAPSSQTKWHGTTLKLSSSKPTRAGYTFGGWATSASGSKAYDAGGNYTSNASVTLYAVWTQLTYTVKYDANGGSGAPSNQTKKYGVALTLSSTKPTRTNYTFKGWGTSSSATTVAYAAGASYTKNAAITLYAVWSLSYVKPRINSLTVTRCTSNGTANENGTYAQVKFSWACDKTVSSIKIEWKTTSATSWTSATVSASGTSGSVTQVVGANALSTDSTYTIRVTVSDASGNTQKTSTLNGTKFLIDLLSNGNGIAFGKPAEISGYMDVGYSTCFRKAAMLNNATYLNGKTKDESTNLKLAGVNSSNKIFLGYGTYENEIGSTDIYGYGINFYTNPEKSVRIPNTDLYVKGCPVARNKILWSGAYYMNESQSCTLSEKVTSQANGIVLVWSEYTDGAYVDANFNMCFVPKQYVTSKSGYGVATFCSFASGNVVATKYVKINDETITGYANNNSSAHATNSGITMTPNRFVLRYVIGV